MFASSPYHCCRDANDVLIGFTCILSLLGGMGLWTMGPPKTTMNNTSRSTPRRIPDPLGLGSGDLPEAARSGCALCFAHRAGAFGARRCHSCSAGTTGGEGVHGQKSLGPRRMGCCGAGREDHESSEDFQEDILPFPSFIQ